MFLEMKTNRDPSDSGENEVQLCKECIEWAKEERRTFLRQSLESRLIGLYYETNRFKEALLLGGKLLKELKKLDDKNLLVEVFYHFALFIVEVGLSSNRKMFPHSDIS